MKTKNSALRVGKTVGILLLIAFVGNYVVEGWNWGVMDFVIVGALLFIAGMALDLVAKKVSDPFHKLLAALAIVAVFLLIWVELAVNVVSKIVELIF